MFTKVNKVWDLFNIVKHQSTVQKVHFMQNVQRYQYGKQAEELYKEIIPVATTKEFPYNHLAKSNDGMTDEEKQEFIAVWPEVVDTFVNVCIDVPKFKEFYRMLMEEHVFKNKQGTGTLVTTTYKAFAEHNKLDPHMLKIANILAWGVNMSQIVFMIADDIMDGGETRFGLPCWYQRRDVGLAAAVDTIALENAVLMIAKKYLRGRTCYIPIVESFCDAHLGTAVGMRMDVSTSLHGGNTESVETFSRDLYTHFANLKGSYTLTNLPVAVGLYLADIYDTRVHNLANEFATECGLFIMLQNDVVECFGNPAVTGKNATDINLGKCTWMAAEAVARATPAQKQFLFENYGKSDKESVAKVRGLFDEMKLLEAFFDYEEGSFKKCCQYIEQFPNFVNKEYLFKVMEGLYRREYDRKR